VSKRIALDVRDEGAGLVVMVTFPTPWGSVKTVDVAVSDDVARRLIEKVESLLAARAKLLAASPPPLPVSPEAHASRRA
jgi:hypothetical protein